MKLIAGDAIQAMRSALDYIVCGEVELNGHKPTIHHGFPIFKNLPITLADMISPSFIRSVSGLKETGIAKVLMANGDFHVCLWPLRC